MKFYRGDEIHGFMFSDYRSDEPRWIDKEELIREANRQGHAIAVAAILARTSSSDGEANG
jgi:hypothetical protein